MQTPANDPTASLHQGSHTHSVARMARGDNYTIARRLHVEDSTPMADAISDVRRKLARLVTATTARVRERLPDHRYTVNTGVMIAAENHVYVCAVVERVK